MAQQFVFFMNKDKKKTYYYNNTINEGLQLNGLYNYRF